MKDRAKAQRERKKKQSSIPQTAAFVCESAAVAGRRRRAARPYSSSHRILLVGEGDLSFAAALAALIGGANLTASTLDTADELEAKYPAVQERLAALRAAGATIAPGVDATSMASHAAIDPPYDRVVYNFPYAHVTKFAKDHLEQNRLLLRLFFAEAAKLLKPGGEVHVRNKLTEPYRSWDLHSLLPESLRFVGAAPFDPGRFPGYECRSNWGIEHRAPHASGDYSVSESRTYVFARREDDGGGPSGAAPAAMAPSALVDAASRGAPRATSTSSSTAPRTTRSRQITSRCSASCARSACAPCTAGGRTPPSIGPPCASRCRSARGRTPTHTPTHEKFCAFLQTLDAAGPDLAAARWGSHKRYLLELRDAGVPIVPTVLLERGSGAAEIEAARSGLHRWYRPAHYVAKPALGSRGDGVERLAAAGDEGEWRKLERLLAERDMLLQPFLSSVTLDGELCLVFVDGELLHAVHKDPSGWGARADDNAADAEEADDGGEAPAARARHVSDAQLVRRVDPLPPAALALAQRALRVAERRAGPIFSRASTCCAATTTASWCRSSSLGGRSSSCGSTTAPPRASPRRSCGASRRATRRGRGRRGGRRGARSRAWGCPRTMRWRFG